MDRLQATLHRVAADLARLGYGWALVGGLAVAVRAEPRTTRDVDVVVAVASDRQAEELIRALFQVGYRQVEAGVIEQLEQRRLATVRLVAPGLDEEGVVVDLLFASCGIEAEIVATAELMALPQGPYFPVASRSHLIAMKVLVRGSNSSRPYDLHDLRALVRKASAPELEQARLALRLIEERGFHRGVHLQPLLEQALAEARGGR